MNQILENIRSLTGNEVIYKEGAIRKILSVLRQGQTVGILIDQAVLKDEALVTGFLGRPALTSKLPALLARKNQSPGHTGFFPPGTKWKSPYYHIPGNKT